MVKKMSLTDARVEFTTLVEEVAVKGKRVILTDYRKPRCAVVSMEDLEKLQELDRKKKESSGTM